MPKEDYNVLEAKKSTFSSKFGMSLFGFLFVSELGICPQNIIQEVWNLGKTSISTKEYVENYIQRPVFDNKRSI
jgi:hypothetical protein